MGLLFSLASNAKLIVIAAAVVAVAAVAYKVLHNAQEAGALRQAMETARDLAEANRQVAERRDAAHRATLAAQAEALDKVARANSDRDATLAALEELRKRSEEQSEEVGPCPLDCLLQVPFSPPP